MKHAVLCYIRHNEKTVMMFRNARKDDMHYGKWNAPGGKFELGESPEDCVIREVYEETDLTIIQPKMCGFLTFPAFDNEEDWFVHVFTADQFTGTLKERCHEGELYWIDNNKLMELSLWEGDKIFMKWLNKDKFFSAKFLYNTNGYVSHSVVFY